MLNGWKKVEDDRPVSWDSVSSIEGTYVSRDPFTGLDGHENYIYWIESSPGDRLKVMGTVVLNRLMAKVSVGQYLRIEYKGKVKRARMFEVFVR